MSDIEAIKAMLDKAKIEYTIEKDADEVTLCIGHDYVTYGYMSFDNNGTLTAAGGG